LDAAVSDGSTSLPLIAAIDLLTSGNYRFTATDLDGRYIRIWRRNDPQRRVILSEAGAIVQIVQPPFLFTHRESRRLFPLNRMLRPVAERFAAGLIAGWKRGDPDVQSSEIYLFNPEFRHLLETNKHVQFRAWDILQPWTAGRAHCVRAMNVLNPGYFDAAQMAAAVRNLFDALHDGGLLAVGSNEDAGTGVDGLICRRAGDRLVPVVEAGRGFRAPGAIAALLAPHVSST
jgi:hypothetical protein